MSDIYRRPPSRAFRLRIALGLELRSRRSTGILARKTSITQQYPSGNIYVPDEEIKEFLPETVRRIIGTLHSVTLFDIQSRRNTLSPPAMC